MSTDTKKGPVSHFFTEANKLVGNYQTVNQAFGPDPNFLNRKFRLTNGYTNNNENLKAFAVTKGTLFIVPQKNSSELVNIFLKPDTKGAGFETKIKYYVYRSVLRKNLYAENNSFLQILKKNNPEILNFLIKVWDEFLEFNDTVDSPTITLNAEKLGISANDLANYKVFYKKGKYTLPQVDIGTHIGNFDNTFGFEIVLDNGDFAQDISDTGFEFYHDFFTAKECAINLDANNAANIYGNLPSNVSEKIFRETVYQFLDPAAYYGAHVTNIADNKGVIITNSGTYTTPTQINTNINLKFKNKNKTYLYIKSKRGRSYNFYPDALIPDPINIIDNLNTSFTEEGQWPIRILTDIKKDFSLQFNNYSAKSTMHCFVGSEKDFYDTKDLVIGSSSGNMTPKEINFSFPYIGPGIKLSSFIYLVYDDGKENYLNKLFGSVNISSIFEKGDSINKQLSTVNNLRPILLKDGYYIGLYNTKAVLDGYIADSNPTTVPTDPNVLSKTLRTYIIFPLKSTKEKNYDKAVLNSGQYSILDKDNYFTTIYNGGEIWKGELLTGVSSLAYRKIDEALPIYQLGISQKEYHLLETSAKAVDVNAKNFFFHLERDTTFTSLSGLKYNLKIQIDKQDGSLQISADSVSLYTIDGYFFFTADYSNNFNYYKEFGKATAEFLPRDNYNGEFGIDWLRKGDIDSTTNITDKPFNKIVADLYTTTTPPTLELDVNKYTGEYKFNLLSYLKLKNKEYKSVPVNWKLTSENNDREKDYTISYINFFRKASEPNPRALLRLFIRVNQKPKELKIKYSKELFAVRLTDGANTPDNNPSDASGTFRILSIPGTQIPANDGKGFITLEIENLAEVKNDTEITVYDENNEICGQMIVQKNDNILVKKVVVVQLKDNLPINSSTLGPQNAKVNLTSDIDKFLSHANIKPEFTTPHMIIDTTGNSVFQGLVQNDTAPYTLLGGTTTANNENLITPFKINMGNTTAVSDYLETAFKSHVEGMSPAKKVEDYQNDIILIFTDRVAMINADGTYTRAFRSKNILFITKDTKDYDIAHEFLHSFEIDHTFSNESPYTYMHGKYANLTSSGLICSNTDNDITDNVMDYFKVPKKTTFKWQWDIMRSSMKKIK